LTTYSDAILRLLNIPSTSPLAHPITILIAFFISGMGHAIPLMAIYPVYSFSTSILWFFVLQALGIYLETFTIIVYRYLTGDYKTRGWRSYFGFAWCAVWFACTAPLFWDDMFRTGIMNENGLPPRYAAVVGGWVDRRVGAFVWPSRTF
jgi:hypothetical protein